ncbi:MAG: FHA domain-containing protein [Armatimonadetes bacterium]|nr:FHA domain-containing protein [Armatimonadota bacterium]
MSDYTDKTAIGMPKVGEATQVVNAPSAEATHYVASVDCPVCHTSNPPSETYCVDCGFLLSSEPVDVAEEYGTTQVGSFVTPDGTREFALRLGENTVGRLDADILLTHSTVSRKHAVVTVEEGRVFVEDVGSTNGTTVAGRKVEPGEKIELADGVEVVFGSQPLIFRKPQEYEIPAEPPRECETHVEPSGECEVPTELRLPIFRLVATGGSLSFDLFEGVMTLGRREGNDIVVPDPYCSGNHARLTIESGELSITDVGSTNGTLVNGVKLEPNSPRALQSGDEITVGQTVFKIEAVQ